MNQKTKNMIDELVQDELSETRGCHYPGCENSIPLNAEFKYCEVCRALTLRNSVAILLDPTAPFTERADMIFDRSIHLMRPDEIIHLIRKVEQYYLNLQKVKQHFSKETSNKLRFEEGMEGARSTRETPKVVKKAEKKKTTKRQKLEKLFGENARSLLVDDPDENPLA